MTEPVDVRLLFFVDRDGKPMAACATAPRWVACRTRTMGRSPWSARPWHSRQRRTAGSEGGNE
jgi:hypothetical protein